MTSFGCPYMGSKSKIVKKFIKLFPVAENFYDLFGGGFSVTHAVLLYRSKDFKKIHFNEIQSDIVELIKQAISGRFSYERFIPEFITRELFFKLKDTDPYVKVCWSFGNNGKKYMFSQNIEPYKKSMHNAVVFEIFDDLATKTLGFNKWPGKFSITQKRLYLRKKIKYYYMEQLQQLQRLQQLQQLQQLGQLEQLTFYSDDYRNIEIKKNSVIYCDIPYNNKAEYANEKKFNHAEFYKWAQDQTEPVFVSEYSMKLDGFYQIWRSEKLSKLSPGRRKNMTEYIYTNKTGWDRIYKGNSLE